MRSSLIFSTFTAMLLTPYYSYSENIDCKTPPWDLALFVQWLVVVFSCTAALLLFLCSIGLVSSYRKLKSKNAPRPLIILIKSISTFPLFIYDKIAGRKLTAAELNEFVNKTTWVDWDIRWIATDSTQGKVLEVISNSIGVGLLIQLRYPIIDTAEKVIFYPKKTSMSSFRFRYASVRGKIYPIDKPLDYEKAHGSITSTLIVL